jgi:hypothetical protein
MKRPKKGTLLTPVNNVLFLESIPTNENGAIVLVDGFSSFIYILYTPRPLSGPTSNNPLEDPCGESALNKQGAGASNPHNHFTKIWAGSGDVASVRLIKYKE